MAIRSEADTHGGSVFLGAVMGAGGRSWLDGSAYGHYVGSNWYKGRIAAGKTRDEAAKWSEPNPIDSLDEAGKAHDEAYWDCEEACKQRFSRAVNRYQCAQECYLQHDRKLVAAMRALDEDPRKWPRGPKTAEEVAYARRMRGYAIWWFEGKLSHIDAEKEYGIPE